MDPNAPIQFKLNLPLGLKQKLEHASVDNRRSLSAEIIARLEKSLSDDDKDRALAELVADFKRTMDDQAALMLFLRDEIRSFKEKD